jgi:hypothetical protein
LDTRYNKIKEKNAACLQESDEEASSIGHENDKENEIGDFVIENFNISDYVAATYENDWFIREVLQVSDKGIQVKFMKKKGKNSMSWPTNDDILLMDFVNIICKVSNPVPVSSRYLGLVLSDLKKVTTLYNQL